MDTRKLIQQTLDAFNQHDVGAIAEAYDRDATSYDPQYENPLRGRDAIVKDMADFIRAFPDVQGKITSPVLVSENAAAFEMEVTGTHNGPLVSPNGDIPPTHKTVSFKVGRFVYLTPEGKFKSCNRYYDMLSIMAQLGLMHEHA
ncbi:ester cyclase [Algoriphagus sp.]|jgi:steroid delta-isomerase-like uncharacterized protein|nr:ester cyclase [Algoriphagus sp.]MDP2041709.1 ester cyclase [Algoriphagus sp.]